MSEEDNLELLDGLSSEEKKEAERQTMKKHLQSKEGKLEKKIAQTKNKLKDLQIRLKAVERESKKYGNRREDVGIKHVLKKNIIAVRIKLELLQTELGVTEAVKKIEN